MGTKSRPDGYFNVKACLNPAYRDCLNRDKKCNECAFVQGKPTEYLKPCSHFWCILENGSRECVYCKQIEGETDGHSATA